MSIPHVFLPDTNNRHKQRESLMTNENIQTKPVVKSNWGDFETADVFFVCCIQNIPKNQTSLLIITKL